MKKLFRGLLLAGLMACLSTTAFAKETTITLPSGEEGVTVDVVFSNVTQVEEDVTFDYALTQAGATETATFEGDIFHLAADCTFEDYQLWGYVFERIYDEKGDAAGMVCDGDYISCLWAPLVTSDMPDSWFAGDFYLMIDLDKLLVLDPATVTEILDVSFTDVAEDAPYAEAVQWAVQWGITTGYDDGTFRPDATCTRGQVVTFLYRMAGEPEVTTTENPFTDVSENSPFYKAILWGVEQGITAGYEDGTFRPGQTCTNAQVLTFFHRAIREPIGKVDSPLAQGVSAAYAPAINCFAELGVLDEETFVASAEASRGAIVTYFYDTMVTIGKA